ncbi:MAG TPA: site-2 protease family protein [Chlamydiales bacterium]|nr:site-2 protease family protein [Chlamydiales bacterium]
MILIRGKIPIIIHPFFWVLSGFIGWFYSKTLIGMLIWVGIIFFSVLIHEFGHALTAVFFKQKAQIQLVALGGLTSFEGPKLRFWQQFLITFNGPLFGFFLFIFASILLQFNLSGWPKIVGILQATQMANLFWTIINLLPVLPLDGGQLLRIVLEAAFGVSGFRAALLSGAVIASILAFCFFIMQSILVGAIFLLFAFQSFDSWRKSRFATFSDREDENRKLLMEGETALKEGKKTEAREIFEEVCKKGGDGLLAAAARQYLAFLENEEGKFRQAYDLLVSVKKHLTAESLCLLHKLAANEKDYSLVAELSSECYQASPTCEVALRNARAFAFLKQAKPAGGWLQTARQHGAFDLATLLQEEEFASMQNDPEFRYFIDQ